VELVLPAVTADDEVELCARGVGVMSMMNVDSLAKCRMKLSSKCANRLHTARKQQFLPLFRPILFSHEVIHTVE